MKRRLSREQGFTIVELMMSLAVLAVGVSGIIAMQKLTAMTNLHSKSVATATRVAQAWQNQLIVDGSLWRLRDATTKLPVRSDTALGSTLWLKNQSTQGTWIRPIYDASRSFGPAFDALGNPVSDSDLAKAHFCVHLQLVPITKLEDLARASNATLRATIRVIWPRSQGEPVANYCGVDVTPEAIGNDTTNFHSLYQTIAIRVHP